MQAERGPNPSDTKGKGTCVTQNLNPAVYRSGALISARWSTVQEASSGWIDLKTLIRSCGWELFMAAWVRDADSSFRVQAMVAPSASPCTKGTNAHVAIPLTWMSFLKRLRSFEIAREATSLRLYTEEAHIGSEIEA